MSGGSFAFIPSTYNLEETANQIEKLVIDHLNTWATTGYSPYSIITLNRMHTCAHTLRRAAKELHLVDYLVASDISEESFVKEWDELDK